MVKVIGSIKHPLEHEVSHWFSQKYRIVTLDETSPSFIVRTYIGHYQAVHALICNSSVQTEL